MKNLQLGMSRTEVIKVMGQPHRVSATGNVEYLIYQLANPRHLIVSERDLPEYAVKLRNGVVEAYGRMDEIR